MKCPGQDMQFWTNEAIFEVDCPRCGTPVEFYKDDTTRTCRQCEHRFVNPRMDFGCAAYCRYAEQCLGTLPESFVGTQDNLLKDKVAIAVKRHYTNDFKRIGFTARVARYAERIGKEEGAKIAVVLCAAYLKDIGYDKTDDLDNKDDAITDKERRIRPATRILAGLGAEEAIIAEVCRLITTYNDELIEQSIEAGVLHDADVIAQLEDLHKASGLETAEKEKSLETLRGRLVTASGRRIAQEL